MCCCPDMLKDLRSFLEDREHHQQLAIGHLSELIQGNWGRAKDKLYAITLGTTFFQTLEVYMKDSSYDDVSFYTRSAIGPSTWHNMQHPHYVASRDTVNKAILTLQLDLLDAAVLMDKAGYTFMWNNNREMAIYFFIMKGIYDPMKVDCLLHECGLKTLFT